MTTNIHKNHKVIHKGESQKKVVVKKKIKGRTMGKSKMLNPFFMPSLTAEKVGE